MNRQFISYCEKNSPRFITALKGNLSEYNMFNFLSGRVAHVECSPDNGDADFKIKHMQKEYLIEHKRARNTKYANGDLKVELQKSRDSGSSKKNRYYLIEQFDIISVDISEHTKKQDDFRFAFARNLVRDNSYPDCLKKIQRITVDDTSIWKTEITDLI